VKLACELPDKADRSLSLWTCAELARTAVERGVVDSISPQSVQRILASYKLKPWRVHHWLSLRVAMDETFRKLVRAWLERHPRFHMHFTPVHCSWMNQIEQWFSILQRKRLTAPNFADLADLEARINAFIAEWNQHAHPFRWTKESFAKTLAKVDAAILAAA